MNPLDLLHADTLVAIIVDLYFNDRDATIEGEKYLHVAWDALVRNQGVADAVKWLTAAGVDCTDFPYVEEAA